MGHIRALEEDLDAVGLGRDFEPRFAFLKEKGKAISGLKQAASEAANIYLASDDDREGEAISYSVALLLKLDPATTPRAVFREITAGAVRAAVDAPRRIDMARVWAQQARAVLDMMVGFTISPLLWKHVGQGLSAGRCQTPALRLLCDREREIREFRAESSWRVSGAWVGPTTQFEGALVDELEDEESARNYLENIHGDAGGTVKEAATRPTTEAPPKPLITSTLQQEVSAGIGIQPKNTMRIAQRLYEAGHITYMRTDCAVLSEEARGAAEEWVRGTLGAEYVGAAAAPAAKKTAAPAPKKKEGAAPTPQAQEAHEAIRPTHFNTVDLPGDEDWNAADRRIYKLIWQRAVQSVMAPVRGEQRTIEFVADGDPAEFAWRAQWRRTLFAGWKKIGEKTVTDLDAHDDDAGGGGLTADSAAAAWAAATVIDVGTRLKWRILEAAPHETRAPARYTEATLVRELEKKGIGRPSTFAQLVGTIMDKAYAEKRDTPAREVTVPRLRLERVGFWPPTELAEKKKVGAERQKLAPTALGVSVIEFLEREFGRLFAYEFTAQMEARLDKIAEGTEQWKALCRDTWDSYRERYEQLKRGGGIAEAAGTARERYFAGGIKAVQTKKGPLLLREAAAGTGTGTGTGTGKKGEPVTFYGWPEGGVAFGSITEEQVAAHVAAREASATGEVVGRYEGAEMIKKKGPFGFYVECADVKVPWKPEDTEVTLSEKIRAKTTAGSALHTLGPFEFRSGPYGVYFFKKDVVGKGRKFVGLASGVDPKALTLEAATKLFQDGLQAKARGAAFSRGGGAGGRGRGRGRN